MAALFQCYVGCALRIRFLTCSHTNLFACARPISLMCCVHLLLNLERRLFEGKSCIHVRDEGSESERPRARHRHRVRGNESEIAKRKSEGKRKHCTNTTVNFPTSYVRRNMVFVWYVVCCVVSGSFSHSFRMDCCVFVCAVWKYMCLYSSNIYIYI